MSIRLEQGDMLEVLPLLEMLGVQVDAVVTDPPYHLTSIVKRFGADNAAPAQVGATGAYARASAGFMGKKWDGGDIAFRPETWRLVYDVMKPGAHLVAFGGTRTFARMSVAIEDAGFEIRDTIMWLYGSGFPKSHDVAKSIDKAAGVEREVVAQVRVKGGGTEHINRANASVHGYRPDGYQKGENVLDVTAPATDAARQWSGWGTALKPAVEPIVLARKPLIGTVAANVQQHGTGAINIDGCRVGDSKSVPASVSRKAPATCYGKFAEYGETQGVGGHDPNLGRWPANVITDGSDEVLAAFPPAPGQRGDLRGHTTSRESPNGIFGGFAPAHDHPARGDSGSAARFFYCAKASKADRAGSKHPTVKPVALIRYRCRLVTPPGGTILDPFAGSGTLAAAAHAEGFNAILVEREAEYIADIQRRIRDVE